jgi:bacterioferritin-associated ferredoxin
MIVCQCNFLTASAILATIDSNGEGPRNAVEAHHCLGCKPECGRCLKTVRQLLIDARGACAGACTGCAVHAEAHNSNELIDEAVA